MGFYGNITNTSRTQFQFDRTYPNRYDMETHKNIDNVYAGRYVLVEYDSTANLDTYLRVQQNEIHEIGNTTYYTFTFNPVINNQIQNATLLTRDIVKSDSDFIVFTSTLITDVSGGIYHRDVKFFSYVDIPDPSNSGLAMFIAITGSMDNIPNYTVNYNIDTSIYGAGRGYDSTVWQKVYMDGVEKYIMIAELNTVVPTFDVSADAPTLSPIIPHFDTKSTDIYYKLHWQPTWGMRVASASNDHPNSDETTIWTREVYNDVTGITTPYYWDYTKGEWVEWVKGFTPAELPAAIYYNQIGFRPEFSTHSSEQDIVNVTPTGISGNMYNKHDGTQDKEALPDIQEITIMLPSIGNAIATVWDTMYGHDVRTLPVINQQGEEDEMTLDFRYRDIDWKDVLLLTDNYQGDMTKGGMTYNVSTVAGCINEVHKLIGMILTEKKDEYLNKEWYDKHYLYCEGFGNENNGKYPIGNIYRIYEHPSYATPISITSILSEGETFPLRENFESDQEYNEAYENFINNKLPEDAYFKILTTIVTDEEGNIITPDELEVCSFNKNALKDLKETDYITYHEYTQADESSEKEFIYKYRYQEVKNLGHSLATIYGTILQMKKLLEVENSETRDVATVTGAINKLNDIINVFTNLIPGEFLYCDTSGKVNSANWTTAQQFGYINHKDLTPMTHWKTVDDKTNYDTAFEDKNDLILKTEENRWISMELDEENRLIAINHEFNPIPDTVTTSDKNTDEGDGINSSSDDFIKLYTPILDNMGHVVGKNIETITLPYNYKSIKSNELIEVDYKDLYTTIVNGTETDDATSSTALDDTINQTDASNSKDLMNINTANKWIQTKVTTDTLVIAHEIHAVKEVERSHNLNGLVEEGYHPDKITVQDTKYDAAGHVIENRKHTYTLPYGFQYITSNGRGTDVTINSETAPSNPIVQADNTQSTFALNSGNRWIRIDNVDGETNSLTFKHDIHPISTSTSTQELEIEESTDVTFDIPTYAFDEAGHYVSHDTKTLSMPFGYGIIVGDADDTKTKASATYDTLTLDTDEWLTTTVSPDKVTFSHDYPKLENDSADTFNMNNEDNTADQKNKITLETLQRDTKGHVTKVHQKTITLPYGYKTFKDSNDTVGSTSAVETQDTFVFKGDSWIKPTVTQDLVTYTHIGPVATSATPKNNIVNPEFGSTFTIEDWHYDSKGHKNNLTTHTVQFPKGSLNAAEANNSDVVLQLEFTPETGAIKTQRVNIANLKLASYNKETDSSDIAATDTLGQALSKLQTQISAEETRINDLELDESAAEGSYISSIKQIDGQVSFGTTELPSVTDNAVNGQYVSAVSESNGKISVSRTALPSVTDNAVNNQYVSAVNQSNGQISITRANLPDYSSYWNIIEEQGKTIEGLVKTIEDLTKRIIDLEAYHNPPAPEEPEEPEEPIT